MWRRRSKYNAVRCEEDGHRFDSLKERERYRELKSLRREKKIRALKVHWKIPIVVRGETICTYIADFAYTDLERGQHVIEDVKGVRTAVYRLKKKLVKATLGIEIVET